MLRYFSQMLSMPLPILQLNSVEVFPFSYISPQLS
ncbi:unnamed protein product [Onchocerca flexuosa]|uniref:Uncharacterized protein n=1 Tax=Onchocerca flexuosa TaxID=387005 RepID=A0A183HYT2_9BILA|nr:unnamed protein product [Onchocerca flexuosa]